MFEVDECRDFFHDATYVWGRLYRRNSAGWSKHRYHYFWIKTGRRNKKFYRIFNNFFIEKA